MCVCEICSKETVNTTGERKGKDMHTKRKCSLLYILWELISNINYKVADYLDGFTQGFFKL